MAFKRKKNTEGKKSFGQIGAGIKTIADAVDKTVATAFPASRRLPESKPVHGVFDSRGIARKKEDTAVK